MKVLWKLICRIISRYKASAKLDSKFKKLRADNPSCKIMSVGLYDVTLGEAVAIIDGAWLYKVNIDDFSYVSNDTIVSNAEIGKFCSIGPQVRIGLAPHPSRIFVSTYPAFYSNRNSGCPLKFREDKIFDDSTPKTQIANDVWIGSSVIVPGGIRVGTGAILAAGSVVVSDVPPYAVVGGNPARVIKYRFPEDQIEILLASEWWNWPIEKILQNIDNFSNLEKFKKII